MSRKIHADLFIDDRMIGGFPGWGEIVQRIRQDRRQGDYKKQLGDPSKRRGFFGRKRSF